VKVCIFEDRSFENFYPLTLTRPIFDLKCGHTTLLEKIIRKFKDESFALFMRDYLAPSFKNKVKDIPLNDLNSLKTNEPLLLINGRWLAKEGEFKEIKEEEIGICKGELLYAYVKENREGIRGNFEDFLKSIQAKIQKKKEVKATLISYPWDLIRENGEAIREDFKFIDKSSSKEFPRESVIKGDPTQVYIAEGAEIHPFVVLDVTGGPIIIKEGAIIFPFARLEGPACIDKDTQIMSGTKIREGTSIGPLCRVGGEVEESIIHGYTNKFHDGFLGHAYVGEWVNIGAMTTNSDIKNDYSAVSVYLKGELRNTGEIKVGSFIGDHAKTSIGTLFNTGSVIGVMCNVVGTGKPLPKFIPSFAWFINEKFSKGYGFKMLVETARAAMPRRGRVLTEEEIRVLETAYKITEKERRALIKKSRRS
jgi:UDP-N-acetylglucosamine diphosphorylase/glucosamine-1-phosphate N-acetyltransferase